MQFFKPKVDLQKTLVSGLVAILFIGASAVPAMAYELIGRVWTSTTNAKSPYVLSSNVPSAWTTKLSSSNLKWNSLPNSTLKTSSIFVTSSTSTFINATFTIDLQDLVQAYGVDVPGLTSGVSKGSNSARVHLNSGWTWSTSFSEANQIADLESVAVHELGHAYGLDESLSGTGPFTPSAVASVMNANYVVKRTPNADDNSGIAALY
jgi:hypothetical protein